MTDYAGYIAACELNVMDTKHYYGGLVNDPVNNPKHYKDTGVQCPDCGSDLETIDIIEGKGYLLGNALKYLFRYDKKGKPVQDIDKAIWYLNRLKDNLVANGEFS